MARPRKETEAGKVANAKWHETMIKKYGSVEAFKLSRRVMGAKGGKCKTPEGGFASNRELARLAGAKGGRISRRTNKNYDKEWELNHGMIMHMVAKGESTAEISRRSKIPYGALRLRLRRKGKL